MADEACSLPPPPVHAFITVQFYVHAESISAVHKCLSDIIHTTQLWKQKMGGWGLKSCKVDPMLGKKIVTVRLSDILKHACDPKMDKQRSNKSNNFEH